MRETRRSDSYSGTILPREDGRPELSCDQLEERSYNGTVSPSRAAVLTGVCSPTCRREATGVKGKGNPEIRMKLGNRGTHRRV